MSERIFMLNRGDTLKYTYVLPETYSYTEGDRLYFGVTLPKQPFEEALIRKSYSLTNEDKREGDNRYFKEIKLEAEETRLLPPATYYYSIKVRKANRDVETLVNKTKLIIIE